MIPAEVAQAMLLARDYGQKFSNCQKRKIGVAIPFGKSLIFGANTTRFQGDCCKPRESCLATHAEVNAISKLTYDAESHVMYCFCEIPCISCLRTIRVNSKITQIFCLSVESYGVIYPALRERSKEISKRRTYATNSGIDIIELDMKELEESHELYRPTTNELSQSDQAGNKDLSGR